MTKKRRNRFWRTSAEHTEIAHLRHTTIRSAKTHTSENALTCWTERESLFFEGWNTNET
jgi:hypothetical protein